MTDDSTINSAVRVTYSTQNILRLSLINARSVVNKLPELHNMIYGSSDVGCFCFTESWLNESVTDAMLDPNSVFAVFRSDRQRTRGGGVCMLISKEFKTIQIQLQDTPVEVDMLYVDLLFSQPYRIFVVYRPPVRLESNDCNHSTPIMTKLVKCLANFCNRLGPTIIVGDFNCPNINWSKMIEPADSVNKELFEFVICNGFTQCVLEPTRSSSILDLVFVNDPFLSLKAEVTAPFGGSDHNTVIADFLYDNHNPGGVSNNSLPSDSTLKQYIWKLGDYTSMSTYLLTYDWDVLFSANLTADSLWHAFRAVLDTAIDMFVPYKYVPITHTIRRKKKYPRNIRALAQRKQCLWRFCRRDPGNQQLRDRYRQSVDDYKSAVHEYEVSREKHLIEARNTGALYKYINSRLGRKHSIGILKDNDGQHVTSDIDKAELLNSYFSSVGVQDNGVYPEFKRRVADDIKLDTVNFSPAALLKICKKLKPKATSDPNGYCNYLLKQIMPAITVPVCDMFHSFLSVGKVPSEWRSAIITPLYKKGPSSQVTNYRPISLTSIFSKLMERVISTELINYLQQHHLITKQQHGFLTKRSTSTNLIESLNDWTLNIEKRNHQSVAYIDFAKAFDSVCHKKLLIKLANYGICGSLLDWIYSFLSDRSCQTKIGNHLSSVLPIISGVVQGSCLGPVLFIIFINDITDLFPDGTCVKLFADDVKLYSKVHTDPHVLQYCLNRVAEWSRDWQLPISENKCCVLELKRLSDVVYGLENYVLPTVQETDDLGVTVDSGLKFSQHVSKLTAKGHRLANLILKCFLSRDVDSLVRAFTTYVRPGLEYSSIVWNPMLKKDIEMLEKVQKRFTKRIPGLKCLTYCQRLARLKLDSLELRRVRADLIFTYKLVFGLINLKLTDYFILRSDTRSRGHPYKLFLPGCISTTRHSFFAYRAARIWNGLPKDSTNFSSLSLFKRSLCSSFLARYCKVYFF